MPNTKIAQETHSALALDMHEKISSVHSAMYGKGTTEGTISAIARIDKALTSHIEKGRSETKKVSVYTASAVSLLVALIPLAIALI